MPSQNFKAEAGFHQAVTKALFCTPNFLILPSAEFLYAGGSDGKQLARALQQHLEADMGRRQLQ